MKDGPIVNNSAFSTAFAVHAARAVAPAAAEHLRELLRESRIAATSERPHDPFSLRCLPQIHGAIRAALAELDRTLGVAELATVSQRRTQHLVVGDLAGAGTPAKLTTDPSERLGMLMLPSLADALVSECRLRSQPASRESVPLDVMEDHVSMAGLSARQVLAATELARNVVATELAAAAQALEFHDVGLASPHIRRLQAQVRERLGFRDEDRPIDVTVRQDIV